MNETQKEEKPCPERGMKITIVQIDEEPCSMCKRCAEQFNSNPFDLIRTRMDGDSPIRELDLGVFMNIIMPTSEETARLTNQPRAYFHPTDGESCLTDEVFNHNYDCSESNCQVGFSIESVGPLIDTQTGESRLTTLMWFF